MHMGQLSVTQLRCLDSLLATCNLSHTAIQLGSSQSVVSRQLDQLRLLFDDPLLVRDGRHFVLTPRAISLVVPLKKLLADLDGLLTADRFDPSACRQTFHLAGSDYVAQHILPDLVAYVAEKSPSVHLHFQTWRPELIGLLATGELDLVTTMLESPPPEVHGKLLGTDHPCLVMRDDHPLLSLPLTEKNLCAYPHVKITGGGDKDGYLDRHLASQKLQRNISYEVPFFESAFRLVERTQSIMTVPTHIAEHLGQAFAVKWVSIPFTSFMFQYYVLWHERTHFDPAHQWLRHLVKQYWSDSRFSIGSYPLVGN